MENFTFLESLTIVLIALLFFKEEITPWIKEKLGISNSKSNATKGQVDELAEYVNHRQTEILEAQTRILGEVKNEVTNHSKTLGEVHSEINKVGRKQEEWEKYGIPVRTRL
jgi:archaellum component FlaC